MTFSFDNIPQNTRALLQEISSKAFIKKFYLAGGTAIALFFHHRRSDDLDFFSDRQFRTVTLIAQLKKIGRFTGFQSAEDTLLGELNGVKISFFTLPYGLLEKSERHGSLFVAKPIDLALMKILAISDRGTKRDFIDLYFLCQNVKPLDELLYLFQKKYGKFDFNIHHIIKSLAYFQDAEDDEMPKMYIDITWGETKKFFEHQRIVLAKKFLL